jgi:hypothetical protein
MVISNAAGIVFYSGIFPGENRTDWDVCSGTGMNHERVKPVVIEDKLKPKNTQTKE